MVFSYQHWSTMSKSDTGGSVLRLRGSGSDRTFQGERVTERLQDTSSVVCLQIAGCLGSSGSCSGTWPVRKG